MSNTDPEPWNRFDWIVVVWFICGLLELPFIGLMYLIFKMAYPEGEQGNTDLYGLLAVIASLGMIALACLTADERMPRFIVPPAYSLAWGIINSLFGIGLMIHFNSGSIVGTLFMAFGTAYLVTGWIGIFSTKAYRNLISPR